MARKRVAVIRPNESLGDAYLVVDRRGLKIAMANDVACSLYGATPEELAGSSLERWCPDDCHLGVAERVQSQSCKSATFRSRQRRADGADFPAEITVISSPPHDSEYVTLAVHRLDGGFGSTDLKRHLLEQSVDGLVAHTPEGELLFANSAAIELWEKPLDEVLMAGPFGWTAAADRDKIQRRIQQLLEHGGARFESNGLVSGQQLRVEVSATCMQTESGPVILAVTRNVTERERTEDMIRYLAYHDMLTGLANRVLLEQELSHQIALSERHNDHLGVAFIDLDRFKPVNDTYGHTVGDHVLREIADRLAGAVRETDTVARLGGDEFVIVLPRLNRPEDLEQVAEKIRSVVTKPISACGRKVRLTCSVGLAIHEPGESIDDLLTRADLAMYDSRDTDNGQTATA